MNYYGGLNVNRYTSRGSNKLQSNRIPAGPISGGKNLICHLLKTNSVLTQFSNNQFVNEIGRQRFNFIKNWNNCNYYYISNNIK